MRRLHEGTSPLAPRIAINATPVLSPLTGIGTYVRELGHALESAGADLYAFYGASWRHEAPRSAVAPPGTGSGVIRQWLRQVVPFRRQLRQAQQRIVFGAGVRRYGIALYHEPNYVPVRLDVPLVVTIHDLSWMRHPDTHPADRVRWLERGVPRALAQARAVLVDSAFVRDEVATAFGTDPGRMHVAHLGVGDRFHRRGPGETRATMERHALEHGSYVLSLATLEPRKNVDHTLAAHALLPGELKRRFPLVVAGAAGWKAQALERHIREQSRQGQLRYLGFVAPHELPDLYAAASAFVYPSLYEGFGLPPLEAMACGVPTLVAARGAMPEVVGDAAVLIDPLDPKRTCEELRALLEDPSRRTDLAARGEARAARFTWARCAEATMRAYARALA